MRYRFFFTCLLCLVVLHSFAQHPNAKLTELILTADTVMLTSHQSLNFQERTPLTYKQILNNPLDKEGLPNKSIIIDKLYLTPALRQELTKLLSQPKTDTVGYGGASCYDPHNSIFFYKEKSWSVIDMCFGCDHYVRSADLKGIINYKEFLHSIEDWTSLGDFFKEKGLEYSREKDKRYR